MINNHGASLAFNLLYNNSKFGKNMLNIIKHAFKSPAHPILLLIFHIIEVKLELVNNFFLCGKPQVYNKELWPSFEFKCCQTHELRWTNSKN